VAASKLCCLFLVPVPVSLSTEPLKPPKTSWPVQETRMVHCCSRATSVFLMLSVT